jgi:hypothetical protein
MSNTLYTGDPLEVFLATLTARTGFLHVLGDWEAARQLSQRPPVLWRHPDDRNIIEAHTVTDRRPETDPFCEVEETIEMIVVAEDMRGAKWILTEIWRLGFDAGLSEVDGHSYVDHVVYGRVRRPRQGEPVPSVGVKLIDLITIRWLAPRQEPAYAEPDSVGITGKLYDGSTLKETVTSP